MSRNRAQIALGMVLLLCLGACGYDTNKAKKNEHVTSIGLQETLQTIPTLPAFERIGFYQNVLPDWIDDANCYVGEASIAFGSTLPKEQALELYAAAMQGVGWTPRQEQAVGERILYRPNRHMVLSNSGDAGLLRGDLTFMVKREAYPTILKVFINYRPDCN